MLFLPQSMTHFVLKTEIKSNLITLTVYCPLHIKFKEIYIIKIMTPIKNAHINIIEIDNISNKIARTLASCVDHYYNKY